MSESSSSVSGGAASTYLASSPLRRISLTQSQCQCHDESGFNLAQSSSAASFGAPIHGPAAAAAKPSSTFNGGAPFDTPGLGPDETVPMLQLLRMFLRKERSAYCCNLIRKRDLIRLAVNAIVITVLMVLLAGTHDENQRLQAQSVHLQSRLLSAMSDINSIQSTAAGAVDNGSTQNALLSSTLSGIHQASTLAVNQVQQERTAIANDVFTIAETARISTIPQITNSSALRLSEFASNASMRAATISSTVLVERQRVREVNTSAIELRKNVNQVQQINVTELRTLQDATKQFESLQLTQATVAVDSTLSLWQQSNISQSHVEFVHSLHAPITSALVSMCGTYILLPERKVTASIAPCDGSDNRCTIGALGTYLRSMTSADQTGGRASVSLDHSHSVSGTFSSAGSHSHGVSGSLQSSSHAHSLQAHKHETMRIEADAGTGNGLFIQDSQVGGISHLESMFRVTDSGSGLNPSHTSQHTRYVMYTDVSSTSSTDSTSHSHTLSGGASNSAGSHSHSISLTSGAQSQSEPLNPEFHSFALHYIVCD
jgi:hypothetical protein